MSMEQAFFADILANPADDAPRLVYADWLEENGDPERAEFIRAQCELARPRLAGGAARRSALASRVKELLNAHGKEWAKGYGKWCYEHPEHWERGLPVMARLSANLTRAARQLPRILASAPVRTFRVGVRTIRRGEGRSFAACPDLSRLRALEVFAKGWDRDVAEATEIGALLGSPHLRDLEQLSLNQVAVGPGGFRAILALPKLRRLYLYGTSLTNRDARLLCESPLAARLTELGLGGNCTSAAAKDIAETPALAGLRVLDFDNSSLGNPGAQHLAGAAHLAGLRELRLRDCRIGDVGAAALAASPHLTRLRALVLGGNSVHAPGAWSLIRSATLPRGLDLDLWDNDIDDYTPEIRAALCERFRRVNFLPSD